MKRAMPSVKDILSTCLMLLCLLASSSPAHADAEVLHTYALSRAHEVDTLIAVDAAKLAPLLAAGYVVAPASALGVGGPAQGIVVLVNFEGLDPVIDHRRHAKHNRPAVDVAILVVEPADAVAAGLAIPGAFHLYTIAMYTDDAPYFASLKLADMPIELVRALSYDGQIDDATGRGQLVVNVPAHRSSLATFNTAFGYGAPAEPLHGIFWYDGHHGRTALHFDVPVLRQANALGQVFTEPGSALDLLLTGGGMGPYPPDPVTGLNYVVAPSLSFSFDVGDTGTLLLIR